jgi:NADH:ubiquinone oxidoreductase subunit F (NADH-binding)
MKAIETGHRAPSPPPGVLRLLAGWADDRTAAGYTEHVARHGVMPLWLYAGRDGPGRLIEVVERAGLRGRGGAGFPTARKLVTVAARRGRRRVVVANGCEGDPASAKDRVLLELAPHLVIDGILLAAHAVGAGEAILCLHEGSRLVRHLLAALGERGDGAAPIRVVEVPRRYVASEESALVNFLTAGDARPTGTPPRPAERGVDGRPTLVDNVETLAHLALIARYGGAWFRSVGTAASPGTTLVTVGGALRRPGVYEIDLGLPVSAVLRLAGGPCERLAAVQIGGLGGTWLGAAEAHSLPLTHEDLRAAGSGLGVAALVAVPARACGVAETARVLRYLAGESAGQCGPCMFGLPAIAEDMTVLAAGASLASAALGRLERRLAVIGGRGACAHPDGAVRMAVSALRVFADDVEAHAAGSACAWSRAPSLLPAPRVTGHIADPR